MPAQPLIQPVILSGGSGTRLWPLSVPERPKQLLALTHALTMLQLTVARVRDETRFEPPILVCGARHASQVKEQMSAAGAGAGRIIVEPVARNTAPAIALAAAIVDPDAMLLVMPSDHVVDDVDAFHAVVDRVLPVAQDGWIVTFGIEPDRPETGYGYIRRAETLAEGVYRVGSFVEKPDLDKARAYLAEGDCLWNSGIFLLRACDYLAALEEHAPDVLNAVLKSLEPKRSGETDIHPDAQAFAAAPNISIDYAVLEKIDRAAVAPVDMGWSDVGGWDALYDIVPRDGDGNALSGDVVALDTQGSLIRSTGPVVATIGVSDLIVVATGDAVLVMPRGEGRRMGEITAALEAKAKPRIS